MKFITLPLVVLPLLAACAASAPPAAVAVDPGALPAEVRAPAGNKPALQLKGVGEVVWMCDYKGPPTDGKYEWAVAETDAKLLDAGGKQVGRLFGKPSEWDYWAGSNVTAGSLATAPAGAGNLAYELLKANPATGSQGTFKDTTYIQRVATKGGAAPSQECNWMTLRQTRRVAYEADYIFYRAM